MRLSTDNLNDLKRISDEITNELTDIEGTVRTSNSFANQVYELKINVDEDKASLYYLTAMDVQKMVSYSLRGVKSTNFEKNGKTYDVLVDSNVTTKEELENTMIKSSVTNQKVLLKSIATIDLVKVYPQIEHLNGYRVVKIDSDVKAGVNPQMIEDQIKEFIDKQEYNNINVDYEGEMSRVKESFLDLGKYALIALLLIFALLVLQFNSYFNRLLSMFLLCCPLLVGLVAFIYQVNRYPLRHF